jgi:hypothetical protein
MKREGTWVLVAGLIALSLAMYAGLALVFRDRIADIAFYTWLDIAFIPVSVLVVSLVINGLLERRERKALLTKLNMVIGAFFSEVGTELICRLVKFDSDLDAVRGHLVFNAKWTEADFAAARLAVTGHETICIDQGDLEGLKCFMTEHRDLLLRLLGNQNLLEHESFTDMLWATSHLAEELAARDDLSAMPKADRRHVELDMARAYGRLLSQWLGYVQHLKRAYPYLFSFAVRTNPFDANADIHVQE